MANHGIAFDFCVSAHTAQLRHVHKAVLKHGFRDETRTFCHQVQQRELGLHIGRERRVRRCAHIDRFRTFTVHVQADPVVTDFDIRSRITQLRQNGIQRVRLCITADNFAARNCRCHQESTGFDAVRQNAIHTAAEALNAFDGNTIGTLACYFCAQRNQEVRGIHDLRFTRGVFDDGSAFGKRCCAHDSDRRADAHFVHDDMRAFQAAINGRFHIAFFKLNSRA